MASSPSKLRNITTQRHFAKAYRLCLLQMAAPAKPRQIPASIAHFVLTYHQCKPAQYLVRPTIREGENYESPSTEREFLEYRIHHHALHALHALHSLSAVGDKVPPRQLVDGCSCSSIRIKASCNSRIGLSARGESAGSSLEISLTGERCAG